MKAAACVAQSLLRLSPSESTLQDSEQTGLLEEDVLWALHASLTYHKRWEVLTGRRRTDTRLCQRSQRPVQEIQDLRFNSGDSPRLCKGQP